MHQTIGPTINLRVSDLVLDPFTYHDLLSTRVSQGGLDNAAIDHLAKVLPVAVAQLDAIGDEYGTLALVGLYHRLTQLETPA